MDVDIVWPHKLAQARLDYGVDWKAQVKDDPIDTVVFTVESGDIVLSDIGAVDNFGVVWITDGTPGTTCYVIAEMTTASGRDYAVRCSIDIT